MIILSHRGYWKTDHEKNKLAAFERSFSMGFGTETDIRDHKGELVISHDIADDGSPALEDFLGVYQSVNNTLPLALNIKADGLQIKLKALLGAHKIDNYFLFDMSVPDGRIYLEEDFSVFMRQSEYEIECPFYEKVKGIWLDEFTEHWITADIIEGHIRNGKQICIVSPELHRRNYKAEWEDYKRIERELNCKNIMICTDNPEEARRFFNG